MHWVSVICMLGAASAAFVAMLHAGEAKDAERSAREAREQAWEHRLRALKNANTAAQALGGAQGWAEEAGQASENARDAATQAMGYAYDAAEAAGDESVTESKWDELKEER